MTDITNAAQTEDVWQQRLEMAERGGWSTEMFAAEVGLGWLRRELIRNLLDEVWTPEGTRDMWGQLQAALQGAFDREKQRLKWEQADSGR